MIFTVRSLATSPPSSPAETYGNRDAYDDHRHEPC
jgi:hypothetical protein